MDNEKYLEYLSYKKEKQTKIKSIEIHLSEHCNLNCRSCDHFSPLAKPSFYDLKKFKKDMQRLSELTKKNIDEILLLGGEPLLNENINEYLIISRFLFPTSKIKIVTNGFLLLKKKIDFFDICKDKKIYIEITKYPLYKKYDMIEKILKKYDVEYGFFGSTFKKEKTTHKLPLDIYGTQNKARSFSRCYMSGKCAQLKNGKIFLCPTVAYIDHFEKKFNVKFTITDNDYIDIHSVKNIKKVLDYFNNPIDFCRYCDVDNRTYKEKWGKSKKDINEWC